MSIQVTRDTFIHARAHIPRRHVHSYTRVPTNRRYPTRLHPYIWTSIPVNECSRTLHSLSIPPLRKSLRKATPWIKMRTRASALSRGPTRPWNILGRARCPWLRPSLLHLAVWPASPAAFPLTETHFPAKVTPLTFPFSSTPRKVNSSPPPMVHARHFGLLLHTCFSDILPLFPFHCILRILHILFILLIVFPSLITQYNFLMSTYNPSFNSSTFSFSCVYQIMYNVRARQHVWACVYVSVGVCSKYHVRF